MEIKEEEGVETTDKVEVVTSHTKEEIMAEAVMMIIDMIKEGNLVLDMKSIIDTVAVAATDKVVETVEVEDITEEMIGMTKEKVEDKIIKDMMVEVHLQEWEGALEVDKIIRVMVIDILLIGEEALKKNTLEMIGIE